MNDASNSYKSEVIDVARTWSDEEKFIFKQRFLISPKNFRFIADGLEGRRVCPYLNLLDISCLLSVCLRPFATQTCLIEAINLLIFLCRLYPSASIIIICRRNWKNISNSCELGNESDLAPTFLARFSSFFDL